MGKGEDISYKKMYDNSKSVTPAEKHEQLTKLVIAYQKTPTDALFDEILAICSHLINAMARKYHASYCSRADMYQIALIGLFNGIKKYNPKKASAYSFFYIVIRNAMIDAVHSTTTLKYNFNRDVSLEEMIEKEHIDFAISDDFLDALMIAEDSKFEKASYFPLLTPFEKSVIELRIQGYTYPAIAKKLGRKKKSIDNCMSSCFAKWRRKNGILTKRVYRKKVKIKEGIY